MKLVRYTVFAIGVVQLAACACRTGCPADTGAVAPRPAPISHFVFVTFDDSLQSAARDQARRELITDADAMLSTIPGIVSYAAGEHLETGRATVDGSYDVGMYIGFIDEAAYAVYVDHPRHVEFVSKWKPRIARLEVRDVLDQTP